MLSRNQAQERMMNCIYNYLFNEKNGNEINIKEIIENAFEEDLSEVELYVQNVILQSLKHKEEIDELIINNLSDKLKLERINIVAHAIFLLAVGQYKYVGEINKSEMINIAVELAKKYLDDGEYRFIHAILDKVL